MRHSRPRYARNSRRFQGRESTHLYNPRNKIDAQGTALNARIDAQGAELRQEINGIHHDIKGLRKDNSSLHQEIGELQNLVTATPPRQAPLLP